MDGGDSIRSVGRSLRVICGSAGDGHIGSIGQRGGGAGVRDGVLARDDRSVFEPGGDVVREVGYDGGEDSGAGFVDAADDGEEVDCRLEAAGEEAGAGEEEVADGGGLEVEA